MFVSIIVSHDCLESNFILDFLIFLGTLKEDCGPLKFLTFHDLFKHLQSDSQSVSTCTKLVFVTVTPEVNFYFVI